nr:hypothetical protein [uncultured Noviherbaspirillum sp.]
MKQLVAALGATLLTASLAYAQATAPATPATPATPAAANCEAQAVSKAGKPLSGAAKASFMKKCEGGASAAASCEAKAVSKEGKPLAGAAKASFMKKCETMAAK